MKGSSRIPYFYTFLGSTFALHILFNILAYYRGKQFLVEQNVSGLKYRNGVLMFTTALLGNVFISNLTDNIFQEHSQNIIFGFDHGRFPTPDTNSIEYRPEPQHPVYFFIDTYQYVQRCLQLNAKDVPSPYLFYGYTVMMTNGTGLRGSMCQERFHDPGAYAQIDHLCAGYACMRQHLFLGCISTHDLFIFHEHNCGRINELASNIHWSTENGTLAIDNDPNIAY